MEILIYLFYALVAVCAITMVVILIIFCIELTKPYRPPALTTKELVKNYKRQELNNPFLKIEIAKTKTNPKE